MNSLSKKKKSEQIEENLDRISNTIKDVKTQAVGHCKQTANSILGQRPYRLKKIMRS